jgi:hypothetical protein
MHAKEVTYNNVTYKSYASLARALGIDSSALSYYLRVYNDVNYAVEKCEQASTGHNGIYSVDHTGRKFTSESAMCRFWGIDYITFRARFVNYGWSLEKALTTPVRKTNKTDTRDGG